MFGINSKEKKGEEGRKFSEEYFSDSKASIREEDIDIGTMEDDIEGKSSKMYGSQIAGTPQGKNVPEDKKSGPAQASSGKTTIPNPFIRKESQGTPQIPRYPEQKTEKSYPKAPANLPIPEAYSQKAVSMGTPKFSQSNSQIKTSNSSVVNKIKTPESTKSTNWTKITVSSLVLIIILASAGGGYYYWMTRKNNNIIESVVRDEPEQPPVTITEKNFSEENPNILTLDLEKVTAAEIAEILKNKAEEVKNDGHSKPVEFVVNDFNNNPISFTPAFTNLAEIKLSTFVLNTLEEKFSIYFYNDNGSMRSVLSIELKDKAAAAIEMKNEEAKLAEDIALLFLGNAVSGEGKVFKSGNYNGQEIRYMNLDEAAGLSLDYALTDKYLVIGTSKDSTRMVLDKMASQNASATPEPETNNATDCPENTDCSSEGVTQPIAPPTAE